jgi:hypothetical protein
MAVLSIKKDKIRASHMSYEHKFRITIDWLNRVGLTKEASDLTALMLDCRDHSELLEKIRSLKIERARMAMLNRAMLNKAC